MYIYKAIKLDDRYIPTKEIPIGEFPTGRETITFLEDNGGGLFRNILHNVEFIVKGKD